MLGRVEDARSNRPSGRAAFVEAARWPRRTRRARYLLGRLYQSKDRLVEAHAA